jgi:hypothetical protein
VTGEDARTYAEEWAAAWNELAVERVLTHFHDQVSLTSPTALTVVGVPTVRGKQALRDYWNRAVARGGALRSRSSGCCGMPALGSWRSSTTLRSPVERGAFQKT